MPDTRQSRQEVGPGDAPVPVVVVEDWMSTFRLPPDLDRSLEPGPAWVAGVGVGVGVALIAATWSIGAVSGWALSVALAALAFVAAWAVLALAVGGTRVEGLAYAAMTAAWIWGAWSLATDSGARWPIALAVVAVGAVGQLVVTVRSRRLALRRLDALRGLADGGTRTDGWIVALSGMPWQQDLTLEAADGSGRTWTAAHRSWRALRPSVRHPVGIWTAAAGGAVVVLAPRQRPA